MSSGWVSGAGVKGVTGTGGWGGCRGRCPIGDSWAPEQQPSLRFILTAHSPWETTVDEVAATTVQKFLAAPIPRPNPVTD